MIKEKVMKYIYKNIKYAFVGLLAMQAVSCSFLDVSDQLASELTIEEVFDNVGYTKRFHANIFSYTPDMSFITVNGSYTNISGLGNPWGSVSDELKGAHFNVKNLPTSGYNASNATLTRWGLYKAIRQAHLFMYHAKSIMPSGDFTAQLTESEIASMKAEARFLIAYYHYLLFELYGPIPIVTEAVDPGSEDLDFERASMDECIAFLDKEFKEVADQLKDEELNDDRKSIPTKGVALAMRAKMWLFAASKLYNGGLAEANGGMTTSTGKPLFPAYDASKWQSAKLAYDDFHNFASGKFALHRVYPTWNGGDYSADESLYQSMKAMPGGNKEIVWATAKNSNGSVDGEGTFRRTTPANLGVQGFPSVGPLQELVDDFFMSDGLSIEDSPLYDKTEQLTKPLTQEMWNRNTDKDRTQTVTFTDNVNSMYVDREPRFYRVVVFQGKRWQIENKMCVFYKDGDNTTDGIGGAEGKAHFIAKGDNYTYTGYSYFKPYDMQMYPRGTSPRSPEIFQPNILIKYSEMLLIGAEILNEATDGGDARIYDFLDDVRSRAGIPILRDIKPGMNKEQLAKAIRDEKRIEMIGDGCRYFDVRRWMLATTDGYKQGGKVHGMDMYADIDKFHTRTAFEDRVWDNAMYLYPIPQDEIQKSKKLIQNPGW